MDELKWIDLLFREMRVEAISARDYDCGPEWIIPERVIADDMFFLVLDGRGWITVEDRPYDLRPGSCAHFRRNVRHSATMDLKNPMDCVVIHYTATVMGSLTLPEVLGFPDLFDFTGDKWIHQMFAESVVEFLQEPLCHGRSFDAMTMRLLIHLVREERYRKQLRLDDHEARRVDLLRLQPALHLMRANLAEPSPLGKLARESSLSIAQFRRVFSRALGISPVAYLRQIRMERACWLLRHTSLTVEAIAAEVGYQEVSFFARTFKELMKTSPGRYRSAPEV